MSTISAENNYEDMDEDILLCSDGELEDSLIHSVFGIAKCKDKMVNAQRDAETKEVTLTRENGNTNENYLVDESNQQLNNVFDMNFLIKEQHLMSGFWEKSLSTLNSVLSSPSPLKIEKYQEEQTKPNLVDSSKPQDPLETNEKVLQNNVIRNEDKKNEKKKIEFEKCDKDIENKNNFAHTIKRRKKRRLQQRIWGRNRNFQLFTKGYMNNRQNMHSNLIKSNKDLLSFTIQAPLYSNGGTRKVMINSHSNQDNQRFTNSGFGQLTEHFNRITKMSHMKKTIIRSDRKNLLICSDYGKTFETEYEKQKQLRERIIRQKELNRQKELETASNRKIHTKELCFDDFPSSCSNIKRSDLYHS